MLHLAATVSVFCLGVVKLGRPTCDLQIKQEAHNNGLASLHIPKVRVKIQVPELMAYQKVVIKDMLCQLVGIHRVTEGNLAVPGYRLSGKDASQVECKYLGGHGCHA